MYSNILWDRSAGGTPKEELQNVGIRIPAPSSPTQPTDQLIGVGKGKPRRIINPPKEDDDHGQLKEVLGVLAANVKQMRSLRDTNTANLALLSEI